MDRPILVSTPLVRPIMDDLKTVTRRLNGLEEINERPDRWEFLFFNDVDKSHRIVAWFKDLDGGPDLTIACPYGDVGGELYVRENWAVGKGYNDVKPRDLPKRNAGTMLIWYAADGPYPEHAGRGRSSIHLPKHLSRVKLEIENIRLERAHAITEEEAKREGVERGIFREGPNTEKAEYQLETKCKGSPVGNYVDGFRFTWMQLNGRASWDKNPWVWVVSFTRLKPNT